MKFLIGVVTVFACTLSAYILQGGHLAVLAKAAPLELVIIIGVTIGGFIIANPGIVISRTLSSLKLLLKGPRYTQKSYIELLSMLYRFFKIAKTKGMLALESHIENPHESNVFGEFPGVLKEHHAIEFFCDYARLVTLGSERPYEIEALMDEELEVHHFQDQAVVTSLNNMADGLPAIGIVAAVLGVIHTMGSIAEPPEVLGRLIGGALVGTFMGVLLSYGLFAPIANSVKQALEAEARYMQCIKVGFLAHLQGFAPAISVEYARKALLHDVRPSFNELEEATQKLPSGV